MITVRSPGVLVVDGAEHRLGGTELALFVATSPRTTRAVLDGFLLQGPQTGTFWEKARASDKEP